MQEDRIITLIIRKLSGEATEAELNELHTALSAQSSFQYFEEILGEYWNAHKNLSDEKELNSDHHFNYILNKAEHLNNESSVIIVSSIHHRRSIWLKISAVAASIIFAGVCFFLFKKNTKSKPEQNTVITAKQGTKSKIILPDGTSVWLNSGSSLSYNNSNFNNAVRYVTLDGEGFFEVTKDAAHPFIVHTSKLDIKVLGTVFNVKSYSNENTIEATLLKGLIEVERKDIKQAPKIILHQHEKFILNKDDSESGKQIQDASVKSTHAIGSIPEISIVPVADRLPDSALSETSWIYNKLIFDGDTFSELALKMERWFNVKIEFLDDKTPAYRFSGVFTNETIEEALQALQLTAFFTYKINGNEIFISKKQVGLK